MRELGTVILHRSFFITGTGFVFDYGATAKEIDLPPLWRELVHQRLSFFAERSSPGGRVNPFEVQQIYGGGNRKGGEQRWQTGGST